MSLSPNNRKLDRRRFLKTTAAGVGAAAIAGHAARAADGPTATRPAKAVPEKDLVWRNRHPDMQYIRLGRTNWMTSRIVAGWCRTLPLDRLQGRGISYYDNALGYGNYEVEMKPFLKRHRDNIFLISKATDIAGHARVDEEVDRLYRKAIQDFLGQSEGDRLDLHNKAIEKAKATGEKPDLRPVGKHMARMYLDKLDESLSRMSVNDVDAYFVHGIELPWLFDCIEIWEAYEKVHQAGKVKHFGFSTHNHIKEVLAAAVEANKRGPWKIDLIMPAINPVSLDDFRPELTALKQQDVGIVAMKTTGVKSKPIEGPRKERLEKLGDISKYNEWECKKLYMLNCTDGLVDAVIAAINDVKEMDRTLGLVAVKLSAEAARELRALVRLQMAGACHLCGNCQTVCPEHIAVTDMIRYHAYVHQYNEKDLARDLYARAGYDPGKLCTNCGKCTNVCPSGVQITRILGELAASVA